MIIETICRDCIFAKYSDTQQYGCDLARLQRFELNGKIELTNNATLLKDVPNVDQDILSDPREYYKINRFCTTCRSKESGWAEGRLPQNWIPDILKEISLKHSMVGVYKKENSIGEVREFIDGCLKQTHLPHEIVILNTKGVADALLISGIFNEYQDKGLLDNVTYKSILDLNEEKYHDPLNSLTKKVTGIYFSLFELPYSPAPNFIQDIHVALNERLERFVLLKPKDNQGLTVQTLLWNKLEGNKPQQIDDTWYNTIVEKIQFAAESQDEHYLIKNLDEIVLF